MRVRIETVLAAAVAASFAAACTAPARRAPEPVVAASPAPAPTPGESERMLDFMATAHSQEGKTAAGSYSREGIVAADPKVLPLGSRIRVSGAGEYSGLYVVNDTGRKIDGREIDIYLPNDAAAQRFGRRKVDVEVLRRGDGRRAKN
jgi:3D (Asp-Asp-Asp) domain-containing protein